MITGPFPGSAVIKNLLLPLLLPSCSGCAYQVAFQNAGYRIDAGLAQVL